MAPVRLRTIFFLSICLLIFSCSKTGSKSSGGSSGGTTSSGSLSIDSVSPSSGASGALISVYGKGFSQTPGGDSLFVNGTAVTITDVQAGVIEFNVPTGLGSGAVTVKVGANKGTGPNFTYVTSPVISILAGGGGESYLDGTGLNAQFYNIRGIAIDSLDNIYVADENKIRKVTAAGVVTTIAGNGTAEYLDGPAASAEFFLPQALTVNKAGDHIYVSDYSMVRLVTGGNVSTLSGTLATGGGQIYTGYKEGGPQVALFNLTSGIWLDTKANEVYIIDQGNGRIRAIDLSGNTSTLAGNGLFGSVPGAGVTAELGNMAGVSGDSKGNLFVTQTGGSSNYNLPTGSGAPITGILRVTEGGNVSNMAGSASAGIANGDTTSAAFTTPDGLAVSGSTMYVAGTTVIRTINLTNGQVSSFAPSPDTRAPGASLINSQTTIYYGVTVDSKGDLILTDGFWIYKVVFGQ